MDKNFIDPTTPLYTLRVAAKLSKTSVYSIRQYVDKGLLLPYKTKTNRRLYSQVDIMRLINIRKDFDEYGLNVAGIKMVMAQTPCWLIKPCSQEDCIFCDAYTSSREPCWELTVQGPKCKQIECRTCNVYRLVEKCGDIKSLFKEYGNKTSINEKNDDSQMVMV